MSPKAPLPIFFRGMYLFAMRSSYGAGFVDDAAVLDICNFSLSMLYGLAYVSSLTAFAFELFLYNVD